MIVGPNCKGRAWWYLRSASSNSCFGTLIIMAISPRPPPYKLPIKQRLLCCCCHFQNSLGGETDRVIKYLLVYNVLAYLGAWTRFLAHFVFACFMNSTQTFPYCFYRYFFVGCPFHKFFHKKVLDMFTCQPPLLSFLGFSPPVPFRVIAFQMFYLTPILLPASSRFS